ncbi:DUF6382 domain-containing protein [Blautia wexlerae]|uniref:DUF6382 domain-containing protein n=1 Tax=Blautia wexlerae TaxID=418240 RepID=UPI0034A13D1C
MRAEYKRDMNHNYLILYGEDEINTDAYQVRMLVGNVIPSVLKCRIQGMDGRFLIYFDITSKQALNILYEERKMKIEDLNLIFGGFVQVMDDAAEYLINPGQFLLSPEYMYADVEKKKIYFCMMPGYEKDIKNQFQLLAEYILPKIDHEDSQAVLLGYGVYKRTMEDCFHLEHIKEELYKVQGQKDREKEAEKDIWKSGEENQDVLNIHIQEDYLEDDESGMEFVREGEAPKKRGLLYKAGMIGVAAVLLCLITVAVLSGYLPYMETGTVLGIIIVLATGVMLVTYIIKKKKNPGIYPRKNIRERENETLRKKTKTNTEIKTNTADYDKSGSEWFGRDSLEMSEINKVKQQIPTEEKREKRLYEQSHPDYGETVVLSAGAVSGPASLVSKEPGELATIYLNEDLTVIGKLENACDAVIDLPTVSRIHAKIRKREEAYYLTDMNSRNGTSVNGRLLRPEEEYQLEPEDEIDFAQARYIFLS